MAGGARGSLLGLDSLFTCDAWEDLGNVMISGGDGVLGDTPMLMDLGRDRGNGGGSGATSGHPQPRTREAPTAADPSNSRLGTRLGLGHRPKVSSCSVSADFSSVCPCSPMSHCSPGGISMADAPARLLPT